MRGDKARRVAVFGSSEPGSDEPLYLQARELGEKLAAAGLAVITGGYGGVMEAASRGAREAGGHTVGVTCEIFGHRRANRWLHEIRQARDLHERQKLLVEAASGFLVLRGGAGTLSELALLWALSRAGCLGSRPVVLLGDCWNRLLRLLVEDEMLEPPQLRETYVASTPTEAVGKLVEGLARAPEERT